MTDVELKNPLREESPPVQNELFFFPLLSLSLSLYH